MANRRLMACAATLGTLALAGAAAAADLPRPLPQQPQMPVKAPFVVPEYNWSGFYVGVNGGGGWGRARTDLGGRFDTSGGVVGGTFGYNMQLGRLVLGFESDIDWSSIGGSTNLLGCGAGCSVQNNWLGTGRARIGYAFDRLMPYVTGGLAVGDVNATATGFSGLDRTQVGWAAGLGVEYGLGRNWSAKLEYLHVDLGRFDCGTACAPAGPDNISFHENLVRGGINLRF